MFSLATIASLFTSTAGKYSTYVILAVVIFLGGSYEGNKHATDACKAAQVAVLQHNAQILAKQQQRENEAENAAMVQLNDLNSRLAAANAYARAHPATGSCFDTGSVRIINSAIGNTAGAAR